MASESISFVYANFILSDKNRLSQNIQLNGERDKNQNEFEKDSGLERRRGKCPSRKKD